MCYTKWVGNGVEICNCYILPWCEVGGLASGGFLVPKGWTRFRCVFVPVRITDFQYFGRNEYFKQLVCFKKGA